MRSRKMFIDDGFQAWLTEGAYFVEEGFPMLMDLHNTQIPLDIVPFSCARKCENKRQWVHFYEHDLKFSCVLTATEKYLDLFKEYDGVITPDCTLLTGQAKYLQQANTHMSRAVGFYLQKNGIPVIPNIRWSDESSFDFCFLGVPKHDIVSISTHGCITSKEERSMFKKGIAALLDELEPSAVLIHGYMPDEIFGEFKGSTFFKRYPSQFERTHPKGGG